MRLCRLYLLQLLRAGGRPCFGGVFLAVSLRSSGFTSDFAVSALASLACSFRLGLRRFNFFLFLGRRSPTLLRLDRSRGSWRRSYSREHIGIQQTTTKMKSGSTPCASSAHKRSEKLCMTCRTIR